jgi:hypothetical protein
MTTLLGALREPWPTRLTYTTAWPKLREGGLELVREWIKKVEKPRLVIVDILERVRSRNTVKQQQTSAYSEDYDSLAALQQLATEAQLSILVLHHQRKLGAADLMDTVSGTLGLGGAVDTIQVLGKDDVGLFLYGRGRDMEEFEVAVRQDERCRWQVLGTRAEPQASPERARIVAVLEAASRPLTVKEITEQVGGKQANVKNLLSKLHAVGEVDRVGTGLYKFIEPQGELDIDEPEENR